jgi:casein kinase II subunit beta
MQPRGRTGVRSDPSETWVALFLRHPRNKYLVPVDDEFLGNSFNIAGLKPKVVHFNAAYELLRSGTFPESDREEIVLEAETLYGILHQRFILTRPGMELMFQKWEQGAFPKCPRVNCRGVQGLPYGLHEDYGRQSVKMFCPGCSDVYNVDYPDVRDLDGAFFGPSWTHMFLSRWPQVVPTGQRKVYVPKIFGFRIAHAGMGDYSESESDE